MEESERPVTEDELLAQYYKHDIPRETALEQYWGRLHGLRLQIFELLAEQNRWMYIAEIARALDKKAAHSVIQPLHKLLRAKMLEEKHESQYTYYRLRPGILLLHQQWLESRTPGVLIHIQILRLLENGEMYQEQLTQALGRSVHFFKLAIALLIEIDAVEQERKQVSYGRIFYRLRPNATEKYQQWVGPQQQPEQPEP